MSEEIVEAQDLEGTKTVYQKQTKAVCEECGEQIPVVLDPHTSRVGDYAFYYNHANDSCLCKKCHNKPDRTIFGYQQMVSFRASLEVDRTVSVKSPDGKIAKWDVGKIVFSDDSPENDMDTV